MRLNLTPWFRDALTATERRSLAARRTPDRFVFQGSADSAHGPFRVTIFWFGHPAADSSGRFAEARRNTVRGAIEAALADADRQIEDTVAASGIDDNLETLLRQSLLAVRTKKVIP